jgi:hemerythrin-like domain-containing protein
MMDLFEMAPTFDDPIGMLRACHRRIERALDVIARVAASEKDGPLNAEAQEALRRTLHYFGTGVPRHAADEEESLFPRLRAAAREGFVAGESRRLSMTAALPRLEALEREHILADSLHQELDTLGETLLECGRFADPNDRTRFGDLIQQLRQLYQKHIRIEDEELFPLAEKVVSAAEQDAVGTEMAGRRGIDRQRHRALLTELEGRPWSRRQERNIGQPK